MMKIEKERKFKREYIPVIISGIILLLFFFLLVLTINYEGSEYSEEVQDSTNAINEDLALNKGDSKCSSEELTEMIASASKVSGNYQAARKKVPTTIAEEDEANPEYFADGFDYNYIEIIISGITDNVYVEITNNFNDDKKTIHASDLNEKGEYRYEAPTMDQKVTYTVDIYANKYSCVGEIVRKVSFDTKIYNIYSDMLACVMYPNYDNCAKLVDKTLKFDDFDKGLTKYKESHKEYEAQANANYVNAFFESKLVTAEDVKADKIVSKKTGFKKVISKIKDNLDLIMIACITIGIGVLVVVLLIFIRRNRI